MENNYLWNDFYNYRKYHTVLIDWYSVYRNVYNSGFCCLIESALSSSILLDYLILSEFS